MVATGAVLRAVRGPALVVAAVVLGVLVPAPEALGAATTPLVAFLVFCAVRGVDRAEFGSRGRLRFVAAALVVVYLLPVVFAPLATRLVEGATLLGVLVVTAAPTTAGSAIVWTRHGGGDDTATVLVAVVAIALAPLVTPVVLASVLGTGVAVDPLPVVRELLLVVGGGVLLVWVIPDDAAESATLDSLSLLAVAALVYVGTATSAVGGLTLQTVATVTLLAVGFLLVAAALAVGSIPVVGGDRAISLFFASGLRNLGIAVAVAAALGVPQAVVAIVSFYVVQQLVAAGVAEGIRAVVGDSWAQHAVVQSSD